MPMSFAASPVHVSLRSVLVATDFSEASRKPLRHALTMTGHYGAKFSTSRRSRMMCAVSYLFTV